MSNIEKVLDVMESFAGMHEEGGNDMGPLPKEALASVGLGEGQPWCAATENLCFVKAGVKGWPATGDTWALQAWARENNCYHAIGEAEFTPARGDVLELIGSDGQPFHTGFVTGITGDGSITTIEANSYAPDDYNETGPKGVHRHTRSENIGKYIRWASALGA